MFLVYVFFKSNKLHQTFPNPYDIFFYLLTEWSLESLGLAVDFHTIGAEELADILRKFYAEAAPQVSEKRVNALSEPLAQEYHKNTLKNLRSGINRHLKNLDRDLDIVRDKIFRKANEVLDGKIKQNLRNGVSRPTKHKDVITNNDLSKISAYLSVDNPVTLRYKVWYDNNIVTLRDPWSRIPRAIVHKFF